MNTSAKNTETTPVTMPIRTTFDLSFPEWGRSPGPSLPAACGPADVNWYFNGANQIETEVTLVLDGEEKSVVFWSADQGNIHNTVENTCGDDLSHPWDELDDNDLAVVMTWSKTVHLLICHGAQQVTEAAAPLGSEVHNAVIAHATGNSPVVTDERSLQEKAIERAEEALALNRYDTGSDRDDLEMLMADLWHLARARGVRLQSAVDCAYEKFDRQRNDPDFSKRPVNTTMAAAPVMPADRTAKGAKP